MKLSVSFLIFGMSLVSISAEPISQKSDTNYLDQGWSEKDREWFYWIDQGSELMPMDIFLAIEDAKSQMLFSSPESLKRFGFLYHDQGGGKEQLPIGFVKHNESFGFTCAGCHTTEFTYQGKRTRIDGGPANTDFETFFYALEEALKAANSQTEKFDRMAARILVKGNTPQAKAALKAKLADTLKQRAQYNSMNRPDSPYGHARLDAFGRIYNRVLTLSNSLNKVKANAPVSYPYLWDAPQHDYVQWVGSTSNGGAGSLARNVGQVVGVFGTIQLNTKTYGLGYSSSIELGNLISIEKKLKQLESPLWPGQTLGAIDPKLVAKGKAIYAKDCISCHADIRRDDVNRRITAQMYGLDIIGTDPLTAQNIAAGEGTTGLLTGRPRHFTPGFKLLGGKEPVHTMLSHVVEGILWKNAPRLAQNHIVNSEIINAGGFTTERQGNFPKDPKNPLVSMLAYKARPLNGTWATAPYLHNGSVPTLYDLLLPAGKRPQKFNVGSYEFDPRKVGFVSDNGPFVFDTTLAGNRNTGHEYGTNLSEEDRMALLEYLKTL